mmetsp:Transcript_61361/g.163143  ORF Transcript_61361/g.163143 Transcript_61361/m.163143 type:complete len:622 (-) Transcript_61361:348-2213(-)
MCFSDQGDHRSQEGLSPMLGEWQGEHNLPCRRVRSIDDRDIMPRGHNSFQRRSQDDSGVSFLQYSQEEGMGPMLHQGAPAPVSARYESPSIPRFSLAGFQRGSTDSLHTPRNCWAQPKPSPPSACRLSSGLLAPSLQHVTGSSRTQNSNIESNDRLSQSRTSQCSSSSSYSSHSGQECLLSDSRLLVSPGNTPWQWQSLSGRTTGSDGGSKPLSKKSPTSLIFGAYSRQESALTPGTTISTRSEKAASPAPSEQALRAVEAAEMIRTNTPLLALFGEEVDEGLPHLHDQQHVEPVTSCQVDAGQEHVDEHHRQYQEQETVREIRKPEDVEDDMERQEQKLKWKQERQELKLKLIKLKPMLKQEKLDEGDMMPGEMKLGGQDIFELPSVVGEAHAFDHLAEEEASEPSPPPPPPSCLKEHRTPSFRLIPKVHLVPVDESGDCESEVLPSARSVISDRDRRPSLSVWWSEDMEGWRQGESCTDHGHAIDRVTKDLQWLIAEMSDFVCPPVHSQEQGTEGQPPNAVPTPVQSPERQWNDFSSSSILDETDADAMNDVEALRCRVGVVEHELDMARRQVAASGDVVLALQEQLAETQLQLRDFCNEMRQAKQEMRSVVSQMACSS